jgi:hypothetical protein
MGLGSSSLVTRVHAHGSMPANSWIRHCDCNAAGASLELEQRPSRLLDTAAVACPCGANPISKRYRIPEPPADEWMAIFVRRGAAASLWDLVYLSKKVVDTSATLCYISFGRYDAAPPSPSFILEGWQSSSLVIPPYRYVAPTYLLCFSLLRKLPGCGGILPKLELVTRHDSASPLSFPPLFPVSLSTFNCEL